MYTIPTLFPNDLGTREGRSCLPEMGNVDPSATRPGSELGVYVPRSGTVLDLWCILVLGNKPTTVGSQSDDHRTGFF